MPLTVNGKLDRAKLPAAMPAEPRIIDAGAEAATETERRLGQIWASVLGAGVAAGPDGVARLGAGDDVFLHGADSLLAMRALARIRAEFGVSLALKLLFDQPVIRDQAAMIDAAAQAVDAPFPQRPAAMADLVPLTAGQEGLWFLWRMNPTSAAYNVSGALEIAGSLDIEALRQAVAAVVARHEALRVWFVETDNGVAQRILADAAFDWAVVDLAGAIWPGMIRQEMMRRCAGACTTPRCGPSHSIAARCCGRCWSGAVRRAMCWRSAPIISSRTVRP
ncbi:condensation domain-containing protein [Tistrella bauzanensis]